MLFHRPLYVEMNELLEDESIFTSEMEKRASLCLLALSNFLSPIKDVNLGLDP